MGWFKRFSLHLAAAVGATGIFAAAVIAGAAQTQPPAPAQIVSPAEAQTALARQLARAEATAQATQAAASGQAGGQTPPVPDDSPSAPAPTRAPVPTQKSVAGTVTAVAANAIEVHGVGGKNWLITLNAKAQVKLNGRAVSLDALQPGDTVLIVGRAQSNAHFAGTSVAAKRPAAAPPS